jgi:hypothetical protein
MKRLCKEYNDERNNPENANYQNLNHAPRLDKKVGMDIDQGKNIGGSVERDEFCPNRRCRGVHEYATCVEDLSGQNRGIRGKHGGASRCGKYSKWHVRKRAHRRGCSKEEWQIREVVAGLREAHREGRYS